MIDSHRRPATVRHATHHRRRLRRGAAGLSGVIAAVYYLIGAGVITVAEAADDGVDLAVFGAGAGTIFVIGAVLLVTTDRRPLWAVGAALQLGIIAMYLNVASERTPAFEAWGISLRAGQVLLFAVLAYLAVRPQVSADEPASGVRPRPLVRHLR